MSLKRRAARTLTACALTLSLLACGGGGDSSSTANGSTSSSGGDLTVVSDGPAVSFSLSSVTATSAANAMQQVAFDAIVSNEPAGASQATVISNSPGFVAADTVVTAQANGHYHIVLVVDSTLAPGTYAGSLGFFLCVDSACKVTNWLSDGLLPYSVTVLPDPPTAATVDGTAG